VWPTEEGKQFMATNHLKKMLRFRISVTVVGVHRVALSLSVLLAHAPKLQTRNDTFIQPGLIRILVAALEPKKSMQTPTPFVLKYKMF
jgi:hypothetical protein